MRDYDPTTGRYMQADPLGLVNGASVYGYARQSPGRYVDPRGAETIIQVTMPTTGSDPGHASLILPEIIYDPSGSCSCQYDEYGGPYPPGSNDYYSRNPETDAAFERYSGLGGWQVVQIRFNTTPEEEQQIFERIEARGGGGFLGCAISVSSVLDGIGPFEGLGTTRWPSTLRERAIIQLFLSD
jgi:hypothetical protein